MEWITLILLIIVLFFLFFRFLGVKSSNKPYISKNTLMTKAELNFYRSFLPIVQQNGFLIFSKVRLWDVVDVSPVIKNSFSYQNKISSKHLDFVICEPNEMKILFAVELDDKSHLLKDRKESDAVKNHALDSANIPLIRLPVKRYYSRELLYEQFSHVLKK